MPSFFSYAIWFFELFGTGKSFEKNPIIGNRLLNRMGLHVGRLVLAHAMANVRWTLLTALIPKDERRRFRKDGYLVIENFLPQDQFVALKQEWKSYNGELREMIQGNTLTLVGLMHPENARRHPVSAVVMENKRLLRILAYGASTLRRPIFFISCIKNGYADGSKDPQKDTHSDTFHPTMKAWLFVEEVSDANGPFNYVPGSNRLTWKRLKWEYKQSVEGKDLKNPYARRGSLRASEAELAELDLPKPKALKVPANTLVMANTHGFHCRGQALEKSSRMAFYMYSRTFPFSPFPGIASRLISQIEHILTKKYFEKVDRKAAANGKLSSFHPVPAKNLHN